MNVKVGACALLMVLALWAMGTPVDAATASGNVFGLTSASGYGRREVAWLDGNYQVWLQRLNVDGTPKGSPILVKSRADGDSIRSISLSLTSGGSLVGWGQQSGGTDQAYTAEFKEIGLDGKTVNFVANPLCFEPTRPNGDWTPSTASTEIYSFTRFMVAGCSQEGLGVEWSRPDDGEMGWGTIDVGYRVYSVATAAASSGSVILAVYTFLGPNGDLDIGAQRFTRDYYPLTVGSPFVVAQGLGDQYQPQVAASGSNYLITWIQGAGHDVAARVFNSGGLGPKKVLVNAAGNQNHPSVAGAPNGGWHLSWSDLRSGNNDVYAGRVSSALALSPTNGALVVGGSGAQSAPTVASSTSGAKAFVSYLNAQNGYVRDLTTASTATGTSKLVTVTPK